MQYSEMNFSQMLLHGSTFKWGVQLSDLQSWPKTLVSQITKRELFLLKPVLCRRY